MALTATATPEVRDEIVARLRLDNPRRFIASFDRPNIRYLVQGKDDEKRQLAQFLAHHKHESGIVYCMTRKKTEASEHPLVKAQVLRRTASGIRHSRV